MRVTRSNLYPFGPWCLRVFGSLRLYAAFSENECAEGPAYSVDDRQPGMYRHSLHAGCALGESAGV